MFKNKEIFIIAEIGQNHQGDVNLALDYIRTFADAGADAVKFQTRNNKYLFSEEAYNAEYNSENAFAKSYGEHREKLELSPEEIVLLIEECKKYKVEFMSTPFDEPSLELLVSLGVNLFKIASFDLGNLPFIKKIAETGASVVMSIGGGQEDQIHESVKLLEDHGIELAVLHCVSEYPCAYDRLGLSNIEKLIKKYPNSTIGSSDHFNGTLSGPVARMLGATVFEKHVTLNRAWQGTDHSFALEAQGFRSFVRDIYRAPSMLLEKPRDDLGEEPVFKKLGKSIIAAKDIVVDQEISYEDLTGMIFTNNHVPVRNSNLILKKKSPKAYKKGEPILEQDLKLFK
jgi:sialic acid synthase